MSIDDMREICRSQFRIGYFYSFEFEFKKKEFEGYINSKYTKEERETIEKIDQILTTPDKSDTELLEAVKKENFENKDVFLYAEFRADEISFFSMGIDKLNTRDDFNDRETFKKNYADIDEFSEFMEEKIVGYRKAIRVYRALENERREREYNESH